LGMPSLDGSALLGMISQVRGTCAITISDHSAQNVAVTAQLKKRGASACLSKFELSRDPESFFKKVVAAHAEFQVHRRRQDGATKQEKYSEAHTPTTSVIEVRAISFPVPFDEKRRLQILSQTQLTSSSRERQFDLVTEYFAAATDFPVCLITFIDKDTQWIKSGVGLDVESTPRAQAFCNHTISQSEPVVVTDAVTDPRFSGNPLVVGEPHIRSYAGCAITAADGTRVGALCVIDIRPRAVSNAVLRQLTGMAQILSEMIYRRTLPVG
jgi:GAF domain-containing protein